MKKANLTAVLFTGATLALTVGIFLFPNQGDINQEIVVEDTIEVEIEEPQEAETGLVADAVIVKEVEQKPAVSAGAYLLNGDYVDGWNIDKRWPVASITKLLSAYVAESVMEPTDEVVFLPADIEVEGASGNFQIGDSFQVRDLVKAMLMVSSNDAASALARHYGKEDFVLEMQAVAARAGMADSQFVEATGLSVQNQSTVEDLVKLVRYIWSENRNFFDITRKYSDLIVDSRTGAIRQLVNINRFSQRSNFLGGKTGTLPESDGNLISIFTLQRFEDPVVIILLGSKDRYTETEEIIQDL